MSILSELRDAIDHITTCTGDGEAWKHGLTPADIGAIGASAIDPDAAGALLAKVRVNHPTLFDARTGAPIPPPPQSPAQRGETVSAIQKAEDDLAQQNSATAQLDLHVVAAILNAHATAEEGSARLRALQDEIEDAVQTRTDLDTAAGAREFQRFLIGKMRQIAAVVESADLDAGSKAALATAWTALYKSDSEGTPPAVDSAGATPSAPAVPSGAPAPPLAAAPESLPPYGSDAGDEALANALLASSDSQPAVPPAAAIPVQSAPPAQVPAPAAPPTTPPMTSGLPSIPGIPALSGLLPDSARPDPAALRPARMFDDPLDLPATDDLLDEDGPDGSDSTDDDTDVPEPPPASTDCTAVRLPDGSEIHAPTAALAEVFRSTLNGTPVVDAYRSAGITVPPPGTAVPHPVEPFRVAAGDVGMFSDRQALALDRDRAVLDGRIQPVASVGGPSFLGWLHPPSQGATAAAAAPDPAVPPTPTPTRPAAAAAR